MQISRHLRTIQENQNRSVQSSKISCNWGENFRLSQNERLLGPIEKSPYIDNYLWAGVGKYGYSIILVIAKIYIFPLLCFTLVLLLKQSQPCSIAWTVTSTAAFCHCWSYMKHSDLWIIFVVYIWYWHSFPYEICKFIWLIFDLINLNEKYSPWDQDSIFVKLGTDYIIYQKLANFMYKKGIHVSRLESVIFRM